jgi:DNA-binding transcriptional LysR family regulator
MIEVREAEYFVAVAEELHFGRAADRLRMSQPPLSQAIRQLERKVGVVLLHRTTRSVTLTSAGKAFLDEARGLIGASRSAQLTARRAGAGLAGELRVGAVASAFEDPLPRVVAEYRRRYPDIQLTLEEIDTHEAPDLLLTFRLDVVIARLAATPPGLRQVSLQRDRFVLVSPRSWPQRCSVRWLRETAEVPWVWIPRRISPDYHDQVVACCSSERLVPQRRHVARSIGTQVAMVGAGVGVAVLPASAVTSRSAASAVRNHRLGSSVAETATLTTACRDTPDPLVERFLELVKREPAPSGGTTTER